MTARAVLADPGERHRAAVAIWDVASGGLAAIAAASAAERSVAAAGQVGLVFVVAFAIARFALAGVAEDEAPNPAKAREAAHRLILFYVLFAIGMLFLFPEVIAARSLYLLAVAHAVLLTSVAHERVRAGADWNAAFLLAGANAIGGTGAAIAPTAAWLALLPVGLALRHAESSARAADAPGPDRLGFALRAGALGGAALAAFYLVAVAIVPAPPVPVRGTGGGAPRPLPRGESGSPELPLLALVELVALAAATIVLFVLALVLLRRLRRKGAPLERALEEDGDGLRLGAPSAIERPAAPAHPPRERGLRAEIVGEYLRFEEVLAGLDLGRAPAEGPTEHARAIAGRFPAAARDVLAVAHGFAIARYGPGPIEDGAPEAFRAATARAVAAIRAGIASPGGALPS